MPRDRLDATLGGCLQNMASAKASSQRGRDGLYTQSDCLDGAVFAHAPSTTTRESSSIPNGLARRLWRRPKDLSLSRSALVSISRVARAAHLALGPGSPEGPGRIGARHGSPPETRPRSIGRPELTEEERLEKDLERPLARAVLIGARISHQSERFAVEMPSTLGRNAGREAEGRGQSASTKQTVPTGPGRPKAASMLSARPIRD